jgi:hypothetical protein
MASATTVGLSGKVNLSTLEANIKSFIPTHKADERDASFDYCFNYFQSFCESGKIGELASPNNLEVSCLHLGFYLASWGMFRGNTKLLQKSARYLTPLVKVIAQTDVSFWKIDADSYSEPNIERLWNVAERIRQTDPYMSDILVTKIMLGVFGCIPAFDTNFSRGCKRAGMCGTFGRNALRQIGAFYQANVALIERYRIPTLDFTTGKDTERRFTRAKVIDMALYTEED